MNFVRPATSVLSATAGPLNAVRPGRKWPISYRSVGVIAVTIDIITILGSGTLTGIFYHFEEFGITNIVPQYFGAAAVVAAFYVTVMRGYDLYNPSELLTLKGQLADVTSTWLGVFLFLAGAAFALKIGDQFSRVSILSFAAIGLLLLLLERVFYRALLRRGLEGQRFAGCNAVLITDDPLNAAANLVPMLLRHGFQLDHQFALPINHQDQQESFVAEVITYLRGSHVDEVVVSADLQNWNELKKLFSGLRVLPLPVNFIPVGTASELLRRPSRQIGGSVSIELQREPLGTFERALKRSIDIIGSIVGLVLLMPLLTICAIMVKVDTRGPILFRQKRCGFNGRKFGIFKFRTMTVLEDGATVNQATQSDARVTRVGKWLRRTSIDELPQLFNVLAGTMSLIGPRPHALAHDNHFDKVVGNYAFRHHVKPGLTGWAQVNGCRGPTPTVADIRRRVEFDLWYIDNWTLRLDFAILIRTALEVMRGRNAY